MSIENVALALLKYQQSTPDSLIPVFVGGTGSGKTTRMKTLHHLLSQALGANMGFVRVLLSQHLPEDIGGYPQVVRGRTMFRLLDEFQTAVDTPAFLFFDEFDKVRPDTAGTVLTTTCEKVIRNQHLHRHTVIAGAMQPVNPSVWLQDETGKALAARMCFLPVPYQWEYIEQKYKLDLPHLHERERNRKVVLPVMEATPRTVEYVVAFLRSPYGQQLTKEEKALVIYGTMNKSDGEVLEKTLNQSVAWVDPVAAAKVDALKTVESLDIHTISQHAGPLIEVMSPSAFQEALQKVWLEGSEEDANTFFKNAYEYLRQQCEASPDKSIEIFGGASHEDVVKATSQAAEHIAKVWKQRAEEKTRTVRRPK